MSQVRMTKVQTSLQAQMKRAGGRTVNEALRQADAALDQRKAEAMVTFAGIVTELERLCATGTATDSAVVYERASALLDLAGFFDTGPLFEATYSLCDISDRMRTRGDWDVPSVAVHVQAMRLMLNDDCRSGEMAQTLLAGLRSVAARIAATDE